MASGVRSYRLLAAALVFRNDGRPLVHSRRFHLQGQAAAEEELRRLAKLVQTVDVMVYVSTMA